MQSNPQFVKRNGPYFEATGQPFRFVGFNIRGLAHYGFGDILPDSTPGHRQEFLAGAKGAGSAVIRIFLPHSSLRDDAELVKRLGIVLDNSLIYQQRVIVCLTDYYETSRFQHWSFFNEDGSPKPNYIALPPVGQHKGLTPDFYDHLYKGPFLTYVKQVVTTFRDHPAVFAWELTNEGRCDQNHEAFINYCNGMSAEIRALDPNHMVTAGIISTATVEFKDENNNERERLYANLDFLTLHDYEAESPKCNAELGLIGRLNKPFIIEEVGRVKANADTFSELMGYWFNQGASGFLGWGFQPFMNGDGDADYGIHCDDGNYNQIIDVWRGWARNFELS